MKLLLILCYFATWAAIPHLLLLKKRPSATLAWLWAILFIPFLGALAYIAIGTHRLKRRRLKRRRLFSATSHRIGAPGHPQEFLQDLPRRDRQFLRVLSRINQLEVSSAESLRVLRNAAEFYPELERRIREARHHIHLEFYIWQPDDTGRRFLRELRDAAARGVKVRLILDGVGSRGLGSEFIEEFKKAGGEFSWFQSLDPRRKRFFLNLRNHRKLQIIDGRIAFVGGMNIGLDYEGMNNALGQWLDVQVEVEGPIAAELQVVFADDWFFATGEKIVSPAFYPALPPNPRLPVHIILGGPDRMNEPISKSIVGLLNEASDHVWIATGYFVPDDILLTALEVAACRGVDVRLLISEKNDHPWLVTAGRSYYDQLLGSGVRIFEYSAGINHAKFAVADDDWAMVGSANFDYRSMRLNFELNLLFHSREQNQLLTGILEQDFGVSQEIDRSAFSHRPLRQKLLEAALRPLSPLL